MVKPLYDIQGKPIKIGYLVALWAALGVEQDRVVWVGEYAIATARGHTRSPKECVVLEEPIWPNG